jgi:hypothetical protein
VLRAGSAAGCTSAGNGAVTANGGCPEFGIALAL